ncbi:hypothetical protein BG006_002637, partial [Podila minutissima]
MQQLAALIRSGQGLQQLQDLTMNSVRFQNDDFAQLLRSIEERSIALKMLNLDRSGFDAGSWKVLSEFPALFQTLRKLSLWDCKHLPGSAVQDMLCSIPSLESLTAYRLSDEDIVDDGRSWTCLQLKKLKIRFEVTTPWSSSYSGNAVICAQLSRLTELEELLISCLDNGDEPNMRCFVEVDPFYLSLHEGLDQLKALKRLQKLNLPIS